MMRFPYRLLYALVALVLLVVPQAAAAQSGELATALESIGVSDAQVTFDDTSVTIAYDDDIDSIGPWETVLYRFANVIAMAEEHSSKALPVNLRITLQDGNVMQITGTMADAAAFLDGELNPDAYEQALVFQPITRGPVIIDGPCDADQGQNCLNAEACGCYPNESCMPDDESADMRGCVVDSSPEGAHLENGQYVCNDGYVWNADITACELPLSCPSGTFAFNGECVSGSSSAADTDYDDYVGGYKPLGGLVGLCGAALCLLVPVVLVVVLVLRRRKRRRGAEETPVEEPIAAAEEVSVQQAAAIPAAPLLSELFNSLEQRHAQLKQAYAAGQLSQDAYHQALRQLVVQDARGHWAFSSGQWMWLDGTQWVPRHPL